MTTRIDSSINLARSVLFATALIGCFALAATASALTIVNKTQSEQKVTIKQGTQMQPLMLKPEEIKQDICEDGCVIALENGDELELDGSEVVEIDAEGLRIAE